MKLKAHYTLRKPSGPTLVGCTQLVYAYTSAETDTPKRLIPCLCFYPAQGMGAGELKKYVSEQILPGTGGIVTNSYLDAPIAAGKHPLLLYSHGFSLFNEANTVQCEELASHGYLVLSIGHQGGGSYVLPNGEMLLLDMEKLMQDFQADAKGMELFFPYTAWLRGGGQTASLKEHREYYQTMIDNQPSLTARSEVWIKDSLVALDMVLQEAEQPGTLFYQHVDPAQIGAFGMSYGGSTALSLTHRSDVIKASANLDGFFYSLVWQQPIQKPILLLQNDRGLFLTFPFLNAEADAYLATFNQSTHANFGDYNEILAENYIAKGVVDGKDVEQAMLGAIDPQQMESSLNALLLDFFNKYLRGMDSQLIDTDELPPEVILRRK